MPRHLPRDTVALDAPIERFDGGRLPAGALRGRVVLVVNTAGRCGFTPRFEGLEALGDARRGADGRRLPRR